MSLTKKCIAECIGTFVLVFFGCGTAVAVGCNGAEPNAAYLMTALAFGLVIVAMAFSIGNISGCHINPAVSLAMFISKKMTGREFGAYVGSQFIGGLIGGMFLTFFFDTKTGLGTNGVYADNIWATLFIEIILTFVFIIAILGVTSKISNSSVAGIVIGLTLVLVHIFGIHFTGTSVNPARSFGPAIFAGGAAFANVWIFIIAPLVGAALAALVYNYLADGQAKEEPAETAAPAAAPARTSAPRRSNKKKRR
ncbi:MAG: aquaporin [Clostridia bacterium]|nr:aquaporin [Clostridia bacterium]